MKLKYRLTSVSIALVAGGCASEASVPAPKEDVSSTQSPAIGDIQTKTRRPDGLYDVTCTDGSKEVRTEQEILNDQVCFSTIYSCRDDRDSGQEIFVKNGKLFWQCYSRVNANHYLLSASTTPGGTVTTLADNQTILNIHSDANSDYLVYQSGFYTTTYAFDTTNLAQRPLEFYGESCTDIAADTLNIYCSSRDRYSRGINFSRVSLSGPDARFKRFFVDDSSGGYFALDGAVTHRIVYTDPDRNWVKGFTPGDAVPISIATAQDYPSRVQIFSDYAYWVTEKGLMRAPKAGGALESFVQQRIGIQAYAIDTQGAIYFLLLDEATNTSSIEKVDSSTTSIRLQGSIPGAAPQLAVDDQYIYTILYDGTIHRTRKR